MKGLLGRKIGMTQVFTDHGKSIPVTVIHVEPNTVTAVFTKEKDGYNALQLGTVDVKKHLQKKPEIGHFKKAKTSPKMFVKEIRNMEGHELGATLDVTLFNPGELVDVTGTSKGKGFAGTIKRHNQHIGPKSHGGGGGSQPVRQTGSLGDISGNKVVKGMTMPGQMGNKRNTQQNLPVIAIDKENNLILIKGSIPGPKKSFVIVEQAVKGLDNKEPVVLVDLKEAHIKNELLEQSKSAGADVNTDMSIEEMKSAIAAALEAKEAEKLAKEKEEEAKKAAEEAKKLEEKAEKLEAETKKAEASGDAEAIKAAKEKAEAVEKQVEVVKDKAKQAKTEANEAERKAEVKEQAAEKLQVQTEEVKEESKKEDKGDA